MLGAFPLVLLMTPVQCVMAGLREQVAVSARYDATYRRIGYPGGDVPLDRGACTDVVVRAYRHAGCDLQRLVFEDRSRRGAPADPNIDHRRVKSLADYFARHWTVLSASDAWLPGDVVCWILPSGRDHTGVVSADRGKSGDFMVVHNRQATREEDVLRAWRIVGHYRDPALWPAVAKADRF